MDETKAVDGEGSMKEWERKVLPRPKKALPVLRATVYLTPLYLLVPLETLVQAVGAVHLSVSGLSIGSTPWALCSSGVCLGRER